MGSVGGGGRYADLTGVFGLSGMSGVGISFGADRIFDVMEILDVFPDTLNQSVQVMLAAMDEASFAFAFQCLNVLRKAGIASELYPDTSKLKKQLDYANKRNIPLVAIVGEQERESGKLMLKDMVKGTQELMDVWELVERFSNLK
jgi:histidyl-tRNA synthetase